MMDFLPEAAKDLLQCSICIAPVCSDLVSMTCKGQHVFCFSCVFRFVKDSKDGEGRRYRIGDFCCPMCRQGNGSIVVQSRLENIITCLEAQKENEEEKQQLEEELAEVNEEQKVDEDEDEDEMFGGLVSQVPTLLEYYTALEFLEERFPSKFRRGRRSCIITVTQLALFVHNYQLLGELTLGRATVRTWRNYDGKLIVSPLYNHNRRGDWVRDYTSVVDVLNGVEPTVAESTNETNNEQNSSSGLPYNLRASTLLDRNIRTDPNGHVIPSPYPMSPIRHGHVNADQNDDNVMDMDQDEIDAEAENEVIEAIDDRFQRMAARFVHFVQMADNTDEEQLANEPSISASETTNTFTPGVSRNNRNSCYLCVHWVQNQDRVKNYYVSRGISAAKAQLERGLWTGSTPTLGCIFKYNLDVDPGVPLLRNTLSGKLNPIWEYKRNETLGSAPVLYRVEVPEEGVFDWVLSRMGIGDRFRQLMILANSIRDAHRNGQLETHFCVETSVE